MTTIDPDRLLNFLLTYRQISTPEELFELLYLRFHTPRSPNMEIDFFIKEKLNPIRIRYRKKFSVKIHFLLRILNFLKTWIRRVFPDLLEGDTLLLMKSFIRNTIEKKMPGTAAKELYALINKEVRKKYFP